MKQKVFTATQARQNFFELLRLAEEGNEPRIRKSDSNIEFKLVRVDVIQDDISEKLKLLEEMGNIGLEVGSPEEMKAVIETLHDIKI